MDIKEKGGITVLWKKPKSPVAAAQNKPWPVKSSPEIAQKYQISEDEARFLSALDAALISAKKSPTFSITRMSNGALSVSSSKAYLGKIKLQGRKTWMQYMISTYHSESAEDRTLDEYIGLLKYWVKPA